MDDVTDFAFREIIAQIAKPAVLFTEFTSVDALFSKDSENMLNRLKFSESQRPIVAQLWGTIPANYTRAANLIADFGFDGIDINMGCPDKNIMKRGSGAALINNKPLVANIIKAIREGAPDLPISVKTRLDVDEQSTEEWLKFLLAQGIQVVTLHSREAAAMSKGQANWETIGRLVKLRNKINPNILVMGNGDVKSLQEVQEKYKTYGVDGVMIGRGIFYNPWLFEHAQTKHTKTDYLNLLEKHAELFHTTWGTSKNFQIMKKFVKVYVKSFKGSAAVRQKLMDSRNYEEFINILGSLGPHTTL